MQNNDYLYVPSAQNLIEIKGEVNKPYTYESKEDDKLIDLIKYAGGFTKLAYKNGIAVNRIDGNSIKTITVDEVGSKNLSLKNGDEIMVNSIQGIPSDFVYIHSSTGVSGEYQFSIGEKIYDMLLKSNSLSDDLFLESAYLVRTSSDDYSKEYLILDIAGIVENPNSESNITIEEYDEIFFLSKRDYMDEFEVSITGGVRLPNTFSYGKGLNLSDLILMSGGLVQKSAGAKIDISRIADYDAETNVLQAKRTIVRSFKISNDGKIDDEAANFNLEPYDQVAIRINPDYEPVRTVAITGEVEYPGIYSLKSKDETIVDLILRAGGIKSTGDADAVRMYRMMEIEEKPKNEIDYYEDDEEIVNGFFSEGEFVQIIPVNGESDEPVNKIDKSYVSKYTPVHVNLDKGMKYRKSKYNIVLHDLDSINIV